jgi:hypothetical protein
MLASIEAGEACGKVVLVVKDENANDSIVSFAKWEFPVSQDGVSFFFASRQMGDGVRWSDQELRLMDLHI